MTSKGHVLCYAHGAGPLPLLGDPNQQPLAKILSESSHFLDNAKGVIILTAHWETEEPHISAAAQPELYFDYSEAGILSIPREAMEYKYPARGDPDGAVRIFDRLKKAGFHPKLDFERGWDHGVFVPLKLIRPQADIPVIQMSILQGDSREASRRNIELGSALEPLRDEGYCIMGSGSSFHHIQQVLHSMASGDNRDVGTPAARFDAQVSAALAIEDPDTRRATLENWRDFDESFNAHPVNEAEHFMPYLIAAGAGGNQPARQLDKWNLFGVPMSSYVW